MAYVTDEDALSAQLTDDQRAYLEALGTILAPNTPILVLPGAASFTNVHVVRTSGASCCVCWSHKKGTFVFQCPCSSPPCQGV